MSLPTSDIEVEKRGLGSVDSASGEIHAVIGCAISGPLTVPRRVQRKALLSTFAAEPAVAANLIATDGNDAATIFVRVPSTPRPAIKTLDTDAFTGDAAVTLGAGTPTTGADVRIDFSTPGIVGTPGAFYRVSVDGGVNYGSALALGSATSITTLGVTIDLESGKEVAGVVGLLLIPASESVYALDLSGVTGTTGIAVTGVPIDAFDGVLEVVAGGNPGVEGVRLRHSLDAGKRFAPTVRLGTSLTFAPEERDGIASGLTFTFTEIPEDAFIALVVNLRAKVLDHIVYTTGGVHGVADATDYDIDAAPTTKAEAITVLNQVLAALAEHVEITYPLVDLVTALRTSFLGHKGETGGVHGIADPTSYTIGSAPANDTAAITVVNQILAALSVHVNITAGGVHGSADLANDNLLSQLDPATTRAEARALAYALAAIVDSHLVSDGGIHGIVDAVNTLVYPTAVHDVADDAITLTAAATDPEAATLATALKAADNTHLATVAGVHGVADTVNVVTAADVARATLNTGDRVIFRTTAPEPQASDVVAALNAIKASIYAADFDFVHVVAEADPSFASTISGELDSLEGLASYTLGVLSTRDRAAGFDYDPITGGDYPGEKVEDMATRLDLAFAVFSGERVTVGAGMKLTQNPVTLWTQRRPVAWTAVKRFITRPIQEELGRKKAGQIDNKTSITNASDDYVEYNARVDDTLVDRFLVLRDYEGESGVYFAKGSTMAPEGSDFSLVAYIRVMNLATRLFQKVGQEQLGEGLFLETTGPRAGKIREADARKLDREIKTAIESRVSATKGTASGISVRASRDDNLLPVTGGPPPELTAEVAIVPLGYVGKFSGRARFARSL